MMRMIWRFRVCLYLFILSEAIYEVVSCEIRQLCADRSAHSLLQASCQWLITVLPSSDPITRSQSLPYWLVRKVVILFQVEVMLAAVTTHKTSSPWPRKVYLYVKHLKSQLASALGASVFDATNSTRSLLMLQPRSNIENWLLSDPNTNAFVPTVQKLA